MKEIPIRLAKYDKDKQTSEDNEKPVDETLKEDQDKTKNHEYNIELYKIVDIYFAFNNAPLIKFLSDRGSAIQQGDYKKKKKIEKKMNKKIFDSFG